jgi:thiol-disulfide isomerase/thioredoxin
MKMNSTTSMIGLAAVIVLGLIAVAVIQSRVPSKYDAFAQCLADNGAKVYTASWCPVCERQLGEFGTAARFLNNKECAIPGASNNLDLCQADGITSVPTWENNGVKEPGFKELSELAEEYGCELPE